MRGSLAARAAFVALLAALLGAAGYGLTVLIELRAATAPATPKAFVQAAWSVYRFGPGHVFHVGQLHLDCKACHRTEVAGRFEPPGPTPCLGCHEQRGEIRHAMVELDSSGQRGDGGVPSESVADCMRCHGFGPDPEQAANDCLGCHRRPHGDTPAITTHTGNACSDCHDVHENRVAPARCTECHSVAANHAHSDAPVERQCLDCHHAHAPAAAAVERCRSCHEEHGADAIPSTATPPGHSCTGCHSAHQFQKEQVVACATCHAAVHPLAPRSHRECTSCHAPHAVTQSVQGNVCVGCHRKVELQHGGRLDPAASCTSCHPAHPAANEPLLADGVRPCAACHDKVGAHGARAHAGGLVCTTCHKPHNFELEAGPQACAKCHAGELARTHAQPGHATCTDCHRGAPHAADLGAVTCATCHKDVHANRGHAACTQCHEPHAGKARQGSCVDCHGEQVAAQIHPAQKVACLDCHEPHRGELLKGVADCSSCHARAKLSGLHEVSEHARCADCHEPHARSQPGARERCLACHEDQRDHQPEAARCEGCHQFELKARGRRP